MNKSKEKQIVSAIYGRGRGWAFSQKDFSALGQPDTVNRCLGRLAEKHTIRRLTRGLYDYPKRSKLTEDCLPPDMDQAANALARSHGWRIQPTGNAALNILGLDTQVPTQYQYLSDGPNKNYSIAKRTLSFKKTKLAHAEFKYSQSGLLVQAIQALGQNNITDQHIKQLRNYFIPGNDEHNNVQLGGSNQGNRQLADKVLKDTRYVTSWIYQIIKQALNSQHAEHEA